jgi:hypothetical protein
MAPGSVMEVIESGAPAVTMEKERLVVDVCGVVEESVTVTATWKLPLAVGVPESTPVFGVRLRPVGRFPEVIDQR